MAAGSSQAQLRRMSLLVPYVVSHPAVTVAALAKEFSVSEEQISEDLNAVTFCGFPGQGMGDLIEVVYDEDRVSISEAAGIDRPLQLTVQEATALVVALRALQSQSGGLDSDAVTSAIVKIESAVGDRAGGGAVAALPTHPSPALTTTLRDALDRGRAVQLQYYVPTRDELTDRVVDPIRLIRVDGLDYLEGWCRRVEDLRMFRVDRVEDATILDEPSKPPRVELRDLTDGVYSPDPDATQIQLELTPHGRWVSEYYDIIDREDHADGAMDVTLAVSDLDTLHHLVSTLGPRGLAATSDPRVRSAAAVVAERSRTALGHYTD